MNRGRSYIRRQRKAKIKERKEMIKDTNPYSTNNENYADTKHKSKFADIMKKGKDGFLAKGHMGFLGKGGTAKKTNTRKGHASYRHNGSYGKADDYSTHDQRQIDSGSFDVKEIMENNPDIINENNYND